MIVHKAEVRLPVAPRHAWEIASSTDALDAAAGLPAIQYRDEPQPSGMSRRFFEYRLKGLRVEGEELPFSWRFPQGYRVERTYTRGPFLRTVHTCSLRPDGDDATFVVMRFDFEPSYDPGHSGLFEVHLQNPSWFIGLSAPHRAPDGSRSSEARHRALNERLGGQLGGRWSKSSTALQAACSFAPFPA